MKKTLLVTYGKKIKHTMDMGGFPDDVVFDDKNSIIVKSDVTESDMKFAFDYGFLPQSKTRVMAHPELTEQQVLKALVNHLDK